MHHVRAQFSVDLGHTYTTAEFDLRRVELGMPELDWRRLYPDHLVVEVSDTQCQWIRDDVHHPSVKFPFDTIVCEAMTQAKGEWSNRYFSLPGSYGTEFKVSKGYVYLTSLGVSDKGERASRAETFVVRSSNYFTNWDSIYERWLSEARSLIDTTDALSIDSDRTADMRPPSMGLELREHLSAVVRSVHLAWRMHFELLSLGYAAYYHYLKEMASAFPRIPDHEIAALLAGHDGPALKRSEAVRDLAYLARGLGLASLVQESPAARVEEVLSTHSRGEELLRHSRSVGDAPFRLSTLGGLDHRSKSWLDEPKRIWQAVRTELDSPSSPSSAAATRASADQKFANLMSAIVNPATARALVEARDRALLVQPFIEDHSLYIEHWFHGVFWKQVRRLGNVMAELKAIPSPSSIFLFSHWEIAQILDRAATSWATSQPIGVPSTHRTARERAAMLHAIESDNSPPSRIGLPSALGDPGLRLIFGVSESAPRARPDRSSNSDVVQLQGIVASKGLGTADTVTGLVSRINSEGSERQEERVISRVLLCKSVDSSWVGTVPNNVAIVAEHGGILSHGAIVARERGIPLLVGVGELPRTIRDGDFVELDLVAGVVIFHRTREDGAT